MRRIIYFITIFAVLIMSWETQTKASSVIPEESIRLRILANSDLPEDQWIKRKVRDAIIEEISTWVDSLEVNGLESARRVIGKHLPEINAVVGKTLRNNGFAYDYRVELAKVPFPTKVYGTYIYPAGEYEALRITLGKGEGQNWWCVLFPPLCFVDVTTDEIDNPQNSEDNHASTSTPISENKKESKPKESQEKPKVEAAFFIIEWFKSLFA